MKQRSSSFVALSLVAAVIAASCGSDAKKADTTAASTSAAPAAIATVAPAESTTASVGQATDSSASGGSKAITLGVLNIYSGSAASWGPLTDGILKVVNNNIGTFEAGGKKYHLEFKTYDTGYDPDKASSAARRAVEQDHVDALLILGGGIASSVQAVTKNSVLELCVCAGSAFISSDHPYIFRTFYDSAEVTRALLTEFKAAHPDQTKVAMLNPDDTLGKEEAPLIRAAAEKLGFTVVADELIARDATDLSPVLTSITSAKPDIFLMGLNPTGSQTQIVQQSRALGYTGVFGFQDDLDLASFKDAGLVNELEGSYAGPRFTYSADVLAALKADGVEAPPVWLAVIGDGLRLFAEAIKNAAGSTTPEALATGMATASISNGISSPEVHYAAAKGSDSPRVMAFGSIAIGVVRGGSIETVSK